MTDIILLKGPDCYRYKGIQIYEGIWEVSSYFNWRPSKWWENQFSFIHWNMTKKYTTEELKETFTVLAEAKTYIEPRPEVIIHWD